MVIRNPRSFWAVATSTALLALGLAGCGIWGEKGPPLANVRADLSGATCPEMVKVVRGTERESAETLECWSSQLRNIWTSIEGERPNELSEAEITVLVKKDIVAVKGDKDTFLRRVFTAKKLLGLGGPDHPLKKDELNQWLDFLSARRAQIRALYRKFALHESRANYQDLELAATLSQEALSKLSIHMSSTDLVAQILKIIDIEDIDLRNVLVPAGDALINLIDSVCPLAQADVWDSVQIGACMSAAAKHFREGAPWIEFLMNPTTEFTPNDVEVIQNSLERLANDRIVDSWFEQKGLQPIYPKRWEELARRMGANPPDLEKGLAFIKDLKGESESTVHRSTSTRIFPNEVYSYLFWDLIKPAQIAILHGLPYYMQALKRGRCELPATHWTQCIPMDLKEFGNSIPEMGLVALRVRNLNYGSTRVAPMDGEHFSRIMFYDALAMVIMHTFHDHCGRHKAGEATTDGCNPNLISVRTDSDGESTDSLVRLIDTGIKGAEAVTQFLNNFSRKLKGLPIAPPSQGSGLVDPRWSPTDFARLVALSSDLLVKRTPEEMSTLDHLLANFYDASPKGSVGLDHWAVTAILTTVDLLPEFRHAYLGITNEGDELSSVRSSLAHLTSDMVRTDHGTQELLVDRELLMKNLPQILAETFPRTYRSCAEFGFDSSCATTFDAIIPKPKHGSRYIFARDLDVMTISAIAVEGLFDVCDRDRDGKLEVVFADGADELDCGFSRTKDVLVRLIDSKILPMDPGLSDQLKLGLDFLSSFAIPRIWAKRAMIDGSRQDLFWRGLMSLLLPPTYFGKSASLGSIYGLVGDIADPERARANRPNPTPTPWVRPTNDPNDLYRGG